MKYEYASFLLQNTVSPFKKTNLQRLWEKKNNTQA